MVGSVVKVEKLYTNSPTRVSILVKGLGRGTVVERVALDNGVEGAGIAGLEDDLVAQDPQELEIVVAKMLRIIDKFNQRYERNSLWRVITQKAGPVPRGDPVMLSFWALSCLPPTVRLETRARLIRATSTVERLRFVSSSHMFKNGLRVSLADFLAVLLVAHLPPSLFAILIASSFSPFSPNREDNQAIDCSWALFLPHTFLPWPELKSD